MNDQIGDVNRRVYVETAASLGEGDISASVDGSAESFITIHFQRER
jgi:hypothetical protein